MGCFMSRKVFEVNAKIEGQDQAALNVMTELGLSKRDIDVLFTAYWDMDADNSGTIQPVELFAYFEVESSPFEKGVFCLFDEDRSGIINFMEFVCAIWNILTLDESNMGSMAFMIADPTGSKELSYSNIKDLLESMHKKRIEKDPSMQEMMSYIKRDLSRAISLQEFTEWCHKHPSILTPLRMLQTHLRFQVIGPNFWTKMAEQRRAHPEQGRFDYIPQLQKRVIAETKFFLTRGLGTIAEMKRLRRRGRGPEGDTRDNITRKQSVLVKYFNLSRFSVHQPQAPRIAPAPGSVEAADAPAGVDPGHYYTESAKGKAEAAAPAPPPARRRRSSFLVLRPVLVIKAEMPGAHIHKKSRGKKHKKEMYQDGSNTGVTA